MPQGLHSPLEEIRICRDLDPPLFNRILCKRISATFLAYQITVIYDVIKNSMHWRLGTPFVSAELEQPRLAIPNADIFNSGTFIKPKLPSPLVSSESGES